LKPAPGLSIEQQPDDVVLAMCLYGEARGESALGKLAVAWVVKNRAVKNGTTFKQECLRPAQFSSFNLIDVNRARLLLAYKNDPSSWARCETIVELLPYTTDPTHGADHYYAFDSVTPAWGRGNPAWLETTEIGAHVFGNTA